MEMQLSINAVVSSHSPLRGALIEVFGERLNDASYTPTQGDIDQLGEALDRAESSLRANILNPLPDPYSMEALFGLQSPPRDIPAERAELHARVRDDREEVRHLAKISGLFPPRCWLDM